MSRTSDTPQDEEPPAASPAEGRSSVNPAALETWLSGNWNLALLLVTVIFVAYHPVWRAGYIWDDDSHVTANPCIVGPLGFSAIWTSSAAMYYPLVTTSFWLMHAAWGLNPYPYHMVNIAMHAACAILLWRVLLALDVPGAFFGAALWALHPVMVESAAWITELKNTQSCFFYLLAILCFLRWWKISTTPARPAGCKRYYALTLLCGTLAILSKSSTVMLPVVLVLCAWWKGAKWSWRTIAIMAPFMLVSLLASGWTVWEQKYHSGAEGHAWEQSWPDRVVIAGNAVWFYLGKLVFPHPLIFIYPRWKLAASQPLAWLPGLAAAAALVILWPGKRGWMRALFFASAYFVVSLFPVLGFFNIYFFVYSFVADHFQYLASMGPLALLAACMERLHARSAASHPLAVPRLCAILLCFLAFLTWRQSRIYRNDETLWHSTLALNPEVWLAHNNLGNDLLSQGQEQEALAEYQEALRINPTFIGAHINLGAVHLQQGQLDEATSEFREVLNLDPSSALAHDDLGLALLREDRTGDAIAEYREALRLDPGFAAALSNLGFALLKEGRTQDAIAEDREAVRLAPTFADSYNNLGAALLHAGKVPEGIANLQEALDLRPNDPVLENQLAWVLATTTQLSVRDGTRAVKLATEASNANAGDPVKLRTLAASYAAAGQYPSAVKTARQALDVAESKGDFALADTLRRELAIYHAGHPYEDTP